MRFSIYLKFIIEDEYNYNPNKLLTCYNYVFIIVPMMCSIISGLYLLVISKILYLLFMSISDIFILNTILLYNTFIIIPYEPHPIMSYFNYDNCITLFFNF